MEANDTLDHKVVLITGAAQRIGAGIARRLHAHGAQIVLHYRHSRAAAELLQHELQGVRPNSVALTSGDLLVHAARARVIDEAVAAWGRLDALVNNASTFYPTPVETVTEEQWDDLMGANLRAPFFLAQAAVPHLRASAGCIVNLADIHAERPLKTYPIYCAAKAGLVMLTKSLACELGPQIRVNAVAPGAILWPEGLDEAARQRIVTRTFLKRQGDPADIAGAVLFLIRDAGYMTGQVLTVDGGRSLNS